MPTPAPAGRRPRVRLRSTTIAYRNHRDDTKTRDAPPASPRSRVDGRGHAAGRSLPPPSPPRAPRFDIVRSRRRVASRRCSTGRRRKYFDAAVVGRPSVVRASLGRRRLRDRASSPTTFPDGIPFRRDPSSRSLPPPSRLRIDHLQPCRLRRSAAPEIVRRSPSQRDARRLSAPREERANRKARHPSSS